MEKPELKTPSRRDVMEAFGDRVLWQPKKAEKEYLGLDENLTHQDLVDEDIADKYEQAQITDSNIYDPHAHLSKDFLSQFEFYNRAEKPISAKLIKTGPDPVTLIAGKYMEDIKHKEKGSKKSVFYSLFAFKGDLMDMNADRIKEARKSEDRKLANFQMLVVDNDTFLLQHRIVDPQYRGPQNNSKETFGDIGLKACEQIVQSYANKENKPKKIELYTAQLDVIMWLYRNGYTPKTDKDKERLKRVMNVDENLVIVDDNFIFEKEEWEKWNPKKSMYGNRNEVFEIIFEKTIEPEVESADKVTQKTRDKIAGLV